jgi:transposase
MPTQAEQLGTGIRTVRPYQIGALPLVYPISTALRVRQITNTLVPSQADLDLGQVLVLLVLNRLLAPQPLYRIHTWLAETVLPQLLEIAPAQVYDMRLGRALDQLYSHLGTLWAQLASRAVQVFDLDLSILHWDITSIYFEGAYTNSQLITYGYSHDHRPDTKQVNLQVDVTHEGSVPVLYQSLTGNTADITRPVPHLEAVLRFFARPELASRQLRPILVSDSKLVTPEAAIACQHHELYYLGPLPNGAATETLLGSVPAAELAAHPLAYRPQRVAPDDADFVPYQGCWRPYVCQHDGQWVTHRALVVWSAGKQRLDEQKRKTALKRLLNALAGIQQKLNTRRFKQRTYVEQRLATIQQGNLARGLIDITLAGADGALTLTFRVNRQSLALAQALDGRYAIATNARHLTAEQTLTIFKGQDGVEKRFRAVKGPLQVHPLFVRSDARIEGLVAITMLALLIRAILERVGRQRGVRATADGLFAAFAPLAAVELIWADGSCLRRAAPATPFQAQVLQALGWPGPEAYLGLAAMER